MVLQLQHLGAEHVGKAGAQHSAEGLEFFGQTAQPEIHIFQATEGSAGVDPGGVEEILGIQVPGGCTADQGLCGVATGCVRCGGLDGGMGAVGGNEVGKGFRVFDVQAEIVPAGIGLECRVARVAKEQATGTVEPWCARFFATGHVESTQVEGQSHQVVAQRLSQELVNLVSYLVHHACADGAHSSSGVDPALPKRHRVEKGID